MLGSVLYLACIFVALLFGGVALFKGDWRWLSGLGLATLIAAVASIALTFLWFENGCFETWQPCSAGFSALTLSSAVLAAVGGLLCAGAVFRRSR